MTTVEWLEKQRLAGGRWACTCGCNKTVPMLDATRAPWCAANGYLDWRDAGYRLVLPDGTYPVEVAA